MRTTADVVVVGGGPAGATAASRLASLGHQVLLVADRPSRRARLPHHLPPTIGPLLTAIGAPDAVRDAGGNAVRCRRVRWGAGQPVVVDDAGALVDRAAFDAVLVGAARDRGTVICTGHAVMCARHHPGDGWELAVHTAGGDREITARYIVDASGGRLAIGDRRIRSAPATTALHGTWPTELDMSEVLTFEDGWVWAIPTTTGNRNQALVVLFADSTSLVGVAPRARRARYVDVVRRALRLGAGSAPSSFGSCDATPMRSRQPVGTDLVRVGDAVLTLDPLSADGVRHAIQSALHGAAVLHTVATRAHDGDVADRFLRESTLRAARRDRRITAAHYAAAGSSDFFATRVTVPAESATPRSGRPLYPDDVLSWSSEVRFEDVPALVGDRIDVRPALHHPNLEDPIVMFADHPAGDLCAAVDGRASAATVIDLLRASGWGEQSAGVLATLCSLGVLLAAPSGTRCHAGETRSA